MKIVIYSEAEGQFVCGNSDSFLYCPSLGDAKDFEKVEEAESYAKKYVLSGSWDVMTLVSSNPVVVEDDNEIPSSGPFVEDPDLSVDVEKKIEEATTEWTSIEPVQPPAVS